MHMKRPDISIVLPCHNEAEILPFTALTLWQQTLDVPENEVIIVVNGSTDDTLKIANSYADERTRIINVPTAGKKNAMNIGMLAAQSEMVLFLDADTFIPPQAALKSLEALGSNNTYLVGAARAPFIDKKKLNIDFPTTFYALHHARRAATITHSTVQGWFMALNKRAFGEDFAFPMGASADDVWLSAYTGTFHGSDKVGYLETITGSYVAPDNITDMTSQTMRHRANHLIVNQEHPELSEFFDKLNAHYSGKPENHEAWRDSALKLGIDFDGWIDRYNEFNAKIDRDIRESNYVAELLAMNGLWERIASTKRV